MLFEVDVEVWPRTQLKNRAEAIVVYLYGVILFDNSPIGELFVDLVLSESMLDVAVFNRLAPRVIKMVYFACYLLADFEVEGLVDL